MSSKTNSQTKNKNSLSLSISASIQSDKSVKTIDLPKPIISFRYFVSIIGSASLFLAFCARQILSVAIVAMVHKDNDNLWINVDNQTMARPISGQKTYSFTDQEQGFMLASYYYSYSAFQFMAGIISDKVNPVWLNIFQHSLSAVLTFVSPFAIELGIWPFIAVRFTLGLIHSTLFSSLLSLYRGWFPPSELPVTICFMSLGGILGMAFIMPYTAWITETISLGGWPMAFYSVAVFEAILPVIFFLFITKTAQENRFVSQYEKRLISRENAGIASNKSKVKINWKEIFRSKTVWATVFAKAGISFGFSLTTLKVPHYFEEICKMNLKDNGLVNLLIYILAPIFQLSSAFLAEFIISHELMSCTRVRKVFETISLLVPASAFILLILVGDSKTTIVILIVMMMCFLSCNSGGDMPIVTEMAPDISGTIFGLCNTMSSAMGFGVPMLVGFLLDSDMDRKMAWNVTFFVGAVFMILVAIFFNFFATAFPQTWGLSENRYKNALSATLGQRHFDNRVKYHKNFPRMSFAV